MNAKTVLKNMYNSDTGRLEDLNDLTEIGQRFLFTCIHLMIQGRDSERRKIFEPTFEFFDRNPYIDVTQESVYKALEVYNQENPKIKMENIFTKTKKGQDEMVIIDLKAFAQLAPEVKIETLDFKQEMEDFGIEIPDFESEIEVKSKDKVTKKKKVPKKKSLKKQKENNEKVMNSKPTKAQCSHCGRILWSQKYLADHMRLHTGERPFACKTCGASFTTRGSLKNHTQVHIKYLKENRDDYQYLEKPFQCPICGKKFAELLTMQVHEKKHTDEVPFECKTCGKKCRGANEMIRHERSHTGERPFTCKTCGKGFKQKPHLQDHERLHTGEKPHICRFCGQGFAKKFNMIAHEKIHMK